MEAEHIAANFIDKVLNLDKERKGQGVGLSILVSCFPDREAFDAYCYQQGHDRVRKEINKLISLKQLDLKVYFPNWRGKLLNVGLDFGSIII